MSCRDEIIYHALQAEVIKSVLPWLNGSKEIVYVTIDTFRNIPRLIGLYIYIVSLV